MERISVLKKYLKEEYPELHFVVSGVDENILVRLQHRAWTIPAEADVIVAFEKLLDESGFIRRKSPANVPGFVIPSEFSELDKILEIDPIKLPPKLIHHTFIPAYDQGSINNCVAWTLCSIKYWQENNQFGSKSAKKHFSPNFIYNHRYFNTVDMGMSIKEALHFVYKMGVCYKETFDSLDTPAPSFAYNEASAFKIRGYARVTSLEALKLALFAHGPVIVALPINSSNLEFWKGSKFRGNHAVTVVGYDNRGLIIRNSWGASWGDRGYTYLPYSEYSEVLEAWVAVDSGAK